MKTPPYAFDILDDIQVESSIAGFTLSDADARSSNSVSDHPGAETAASISGADIELGSYMPDCDVSSLDLSTAEITPSDHDGSLRSGADGVQSDPDFADHSTGSTGLLSAASDVAAINPPTATSDDSGLAGSTNPVIVPDLMVGSSEASAPDTPTVGGDSCDPDIHSPQNTSAEIPSEDLGKLDDDNGGNGLVLPNNGVAALGISPPVSVNESENPIASALGAQSGLTNVALPPASSVAVADLQAPFDAPPVSATMSPSPNLTSIITYGDLGEAQASIVQSSSSSNSVASSQHSSGLVINITYDSSVADAPAGFEAVVASVVQFYESEFTNPITLNIDVGWGEIDGQTLASGALGESESFLKSFNYSQIRAALVGNAASSNQLSAVSSLPSSAPVNGNFYLTLADATALGLYSSSTALDGYVGFSSSATYGYNDSSGVPAGDYDLYGVVAHEISEVMGRISLLATSNGYSDLDLFRYSAPGIRSFLGTTSAYFSANGGNTDLNYFNSNPSGDFGDWASSAGNDAYDAFGGPGVVNAVTAADLTVMNVLGYNLATTPAPPPSPGPTITAAVETPSTGDLNAGKTVTITLDFSTPVAISGGTPTLTLNDGGIATYSSGSSSAALSFVYTVAASDSDLSSLTVVAVNLNGSTIAGSAGNAQVSLSGLTQSGPQIDTTIPTVTSIVEAPSTGAVTAGEQVVFTLNLTEAATVSGTPSLTLNNDGVATFSGGSGSTSLTFSYTVAASNTDVAALTVTAVNLNGGSIEDGAGNNANLALSGLSQTGPQVAEMSTTEIDEIYQAVLQRAPTAAEVATWLATEPPVGEAAIISALVDSPEAQQYVYPVIQIIELATGLAPTSGQVDGWVNAVRAYVAQGETLAQALTAVAFAFTNDNTAFENEYGTTSTSIIKGIYGNAFGTTPTPAQISAWSVDTPAEILYAFATSTVYSDTLQTSIQQYLTAAAQTAVEANGGAGNGGSSVDNTTYVDSDYLVDTLVNSAAGITNTYNFGNSATLEAGGFTHGNAVVNMVGSSPELEIVATAAFMLDNLTYNGTLVLDSTGGAITVTSLTDTTTDTTISLVGGSAANGIAIGSINDPGLTLINGTDSIGALTLGAAATPLSQVDLTVLGGTGTLTVVASGAGDIVSELATSTAGGTITATGAGDAITAANGANTITATGANDLINLGVVATGTSIIAAQTIHAMGANDIIAFATTAVDGTAVTWAGASTVDGGSSSLGIGPHDKITFGNNIGNGSETIVITGDLTGATTSGGSSISGIAMITLDNVVDNAGDKLVFNNAITEMLAVPTGSNQVNVTGAASLGQALDIAAADAALSQKGGLIAGHTGVIDWFQYAGNTYLVEAINPTSVAASHTALAATDEVVKIVGLVSLNGEGFVDHTFTL